jgi:hypothetical protein
LHKFRTARREIRPAARSRIAEKSRKAGTCRDRADSHCGHEPGSKVVHRRVSSPFEGCNPRLTVAEIVPDTHPMPRFIPLDEEIERRSVGGNSLRRRRYNSPAHL